MNDRQKLISDLIEQLDWTSTSNTIPLLGSVLEAIEALGLSLVPTAHRYTQIQTLDAVDTTAVDAMVANEGWELLHCGMGTSGQTTLTFGWPSRGST
jgi:hypothetical protein